MISSKESVKELISGLALLSKAKKKVGNFGLYYVIIEKFDCAVGSVSVFVCMNKCVCEKATQVCTGQR